MARDNQPPFCSCGHSWWHHCGFLQPGCTYLGSCRCTRYDGPDSLDGLMQARIRLDT